MSRLKTAEITASNYASVYDYYESIDMHRLLPIIADRVTATLFHPTVMLPEVTRDYIQQRAETKQPVILVSNHVRYHDHNVISAAIHQLPRLRQQIVGNTFVFAKAPYFQTPISRWYNEMVNAVPVFRKIDIINETTVGDPRMAAGRAADRLVAMSLNRLAAGQNLFFFPEGTRTKGKWREIQPLEAGIGHIAYKAWQRELDVGIIPMAIAYDQQSRLDVLKAVVQFGEPLLPQTGLRHSLITAQTELAMRACVTAAYKQLDVRT